MVGCFGHYLRDEIHMLRLPLSERNTVTLHERRRRPMLARPIRAAIKDYITDRRASYLEHPDK